MPITGAPTKGTKPRRSSSLIHSNAGYKFPSRVRQPRIIGPASVPSACPALWLILTLSRPPRLWRC
jgi:hypothetical protein